MLPPSEGIYFLICMLLKLQVGRTGFANQTPPLVNLTKGYLEPELSSKSRESWKNVEMMHDKAVLCTVCWSMDCRCSVEEKYGSEPLCTKCYDLPCACRADFGGSYPASFMTHIPPYVDDYEFSPDLDIAHQGLSQDQIDFLEKTKRIETSGFGHGNFSNSPIDFGP